MDAVFTLQCKETSTKVQNAFSSRGISIQVQFSPSEHKHMQLFGVTAAALGGRQAGRDTMERAGWIFETAWSESAAVPTIPGKTDHIRGNQR